MRDKYDCSSNYHFEIKRVEYDCYNNVIEYDVVIVDNNASRSIRCISSHKSSCFLHFEIKER